MNGLCHGNIYVNQTLHLPSLASIIGNIHAKKLKIDEGYT